MKLKQIKDWCIERWMSEVLRPEYNEEVDCFINKLIEHRDELIFCEIDEKYLSFIFEGKVFSLNRETALAYGDERDYNYYLSICHVCSLERVLQDIRNNPKILEKYAFAQWLALNASIGREAYFFLRPSWKTMKRFETLIEKPALHVFSVFGIPTGEDKHEVSFECDDEKPKPSHVLIKLDDKISRVDFIDNKFIHYFHDTPTEL